MAAPARVQPDIRRYLAVAILVLAAGAAASLIAVLVQARSAHLETPVEPDVSDPVLVDLQGRMNAYLDLRMSLARQLRPLTSTSSSPELTARQEALAAAIKEARKNAHQGDLVPKAMADRLRSIVKADLKSRSPEDRAALYAEVPAGMTLGINRTFPSQVALPTVPPLLLKSLPVLPDNLQYRFANRHLIIVDGDTQVIVDYVPDVLPPK
jgi:hypothetical protein